MKVWSVLSVVLVKLNHSKECSLPVAALKNSIMNI